MTLDYERLENLVSRFKWDKEDSYSYGQIVWSVDRNAVDPEFYFDEVLRNFGNNVEFKNVFGNGYLAITIGDWLYFGPKDDIDIGSNTVLLRRIRWSRLNLVGVKAVEEED